MIASLKFYADLSVKSPRLINSSACLDCYTAFSTSFSTWLLEYCVANLAWCPVCGVAQILQSFHSSSERKTGGGGKKEQFLAGGPLDFDPPRRNKNRLEEREREKKGSQCWVSWGNSRRAANLDSLHEGTRRRRCANVRTESLAWRTRANAWKLVFEAPRVQLDRCSLDRV